MKNIKIIIPTLIAGAIIGFLISGYFNKTNNHIISDSNNQQINTSDNQNEIWTCSMHPQVRQNEPGICPICEMDLIPLDNTLANDDPTILQMTNEAAKLAQVETTIVGGVSSTSSSKIVKVDGTVELDERSINSQSIHVAGRIEELLVNFEGEYVAAGQKIARIYSMELLAASQELITAAQFENKVTGIKDASIQKLKNWKISDSQIQNILDTGRPIETIDIYADHSGYILNKKASLGDYVRQGQSLYTLGQTGRLWLIFNVFETDLGNIRKGQRMTFTTPSLGEKAFTARVNYIEPLLDPVSRTAVVRAEISNPGNQLKPGMLLKGEIAGSSTQLSRPSSVSIPKSAVLWTGDRSVVYVQIPDTDIPSYQFREVSLGDYSGNMISVIEGLEDGEEIVTQGAFAIDAAAQLNNNLSMMNKDVTLKKEESRELAPDYTKQTPAEFKDQLDIAVQKYIELKDALVLTDSKSGSLSAGAVIASLEGINMTLLDGEARLFWMEQLKAIMAHTSKIQKASDVEEQRNEFEFLSDVFILALKSFGTSENNYYVLYCPMAKGNKGAHWLSGEEAVRNPYFGDKMMKCGSVKIELNKNYKPGSRPSNDASHNHSL